MLRFLKFLPHIKYLHKTFVSIHFCPCTEPSLNKRTVYFKHQKKKRRKVRLPYPGKYREKYKILLFSKKFQHIRPGAYEQGLKGQTDWIQILAT